MSKSAPPRFNSHLWWIGCGEPPGLVLAGNNMESQPKIGVWSRWYSSPTAAWWTLLVSAWLVHCLRLGSQGRRRSCSECTWILSFLLSMWQQLSKNTVLLQGNGAFCSQGVPKTGCMLGILLSFIPPLGHFFQYWLVWENILRLSPQALHKENFCLDSILGEN